MDNIEKQWLSIEQATKLLDWCHSNMYYYLKPERQGKPNLDIPPFEIIAGRKVFDKEALLKWHESLKDKRKLKTIEF